MFSKEDQSAEFKETFEEWKSSNDAYPKRTKQINTFRPIARDILAQLVAKGSVTNEDLTGLIHLFRPKPVGELANKYLAHLVADKSKARELSEQLQATGLGGYTAPGRLKIHDLTTEQLRDVHAFLRDAFNVTTAAEASQLCAAYDRKKVTYVTPGIYSPWLHYIQPELFPILNDATKAFFKAQGLPVEYPALITRVPELAQAIGEKDLGLLDAFAWGHQPEEMSEDPTNGEWRKAKWIKKISREDWEHFLGTCGELINRFKLGPDDPRLAMNLRRDSARRVSVNVLNRLALGIEHKGETSLRIMLPRGEHERFPDIPLQDPDPFSGPPEAVLWRLPYEAYRTDPGVLLDACFDACETLLPKGESSTFRVHHIHDLYRMAVDHDFREKALDHLLDGKGEWPGTSGAPTTSYWIFQSNPKWYDAVGALRDNAVDRWSIDVHKQRIKPGDKAILWVTGKEGGCCALATVTTPVQPMDQGTSSYARSPDFAGVHDRVGISIDHNLWDRPIGKSEADEHVEGLKAGNQGTTFSATKEQYDFFLQRATATKANAMHDLNTILYGPPGTGKTYSTVDHAMAIVEQRPVAQYALENRTALRERFDAMVKAGRIQFTTFHQSFSYEDFIEGIKPETDDETGQVSYAVRPGVFKRITVEAGYEFVIPVASKSEEELPFDELFERYTNQVEEALAAKKKVIIPTRSGKKLEVIDISERGNLLLKHVNSSTTRTYVISLNRSRALNAAFPDLDALENIDRDFRAVIGGSNGTAYWAVLNQIRSMPHEKMEQAPIVGSLLFEDKLPIVERIDWNSPGLRSLKAKPYVLVIDEINRGNIAAIFGELITLIEPDKRALGAEAATASLPYSKKSFCVPPNLHILGTMNTADRSVEALDTALRRRFSFVEMPSKPELIEQPEGLSVDLRQLLTTMNARIEQLLDKDHHIGHSYFMGIASAADPEAELKRVFKNKVLPLLEEYFYGDAVKVGMVLGKAFVPQPEKKKGTPFAEGYRSEEVETKPIYRINDPKTLSLADFESIYA